MSQRIIRAAVALAATGAAAGGGVAAAQATPHAKPVKVTGGQAVLTLSGAAASTLRDAGVTVSALAPATAANGTVTLPVGRGRVKATASKGIVRLRGGIALSTAKRTVALRHPIVVNLARRHFVTVTLGRGACRAARHAFGRRVARRHALGCTIRAFALRNRKRDGAVVSADLVLTKASARLLNRWLGTSLQAGAVAGGGTLTLSTATS
jgi:hypothetical protein